MVVEESFFLHRCLIRAVPLLTFSKYFCSILSHFPHNLCRYQQNPLYFDKGCVNFGINYEQNCFIGLGPGDGIHITSYEILKIIAWVGGGV